MNYWQIVKDVLFCKEGIKRLIGAALVIVIQFTVVPKYLTDKFLFVGSTVCFVIVLLLITSLSVEITRRANALEAEEHKAKQAQMHGKKRK